MPDPTDFGQLDAAREMQATEREEADRQDAAGALPEDVVVAKVALFAFLEAAIAVARLGGVVDLQTARDSVDALIAAAARSSEVAELRDAVRACAHVSVSLDEGDCRYCTAYLRQGETWSDDNMPIPFDRHDVDCPLQVLATLSELPDVSEATRDEA